MNRFPAILLFFLSISIHAEDFDFVFVHQAQYGEPDMDSIDYCKLIRDKKQISILFNALRKSESGNYLCGYKYSFEFVKNNKVVSSTWIQPSCENKKLLKIISKYFPDKRDSLFVYLYRIPAQKKPMEAVKEYGRSNFILIADDRETQRWPYLKLSYHFEQKWLSFDESRKKRDSVEARWKKRISVLDSLVKATFPNRAFYDNDGTSSGGGPEKDWYDGYIELRVYDPAELQEKTVFSGLPEVVEVKTEIPETYHLLLISNKRNLVKTDINARYLCSEGADWEKDSAKGN
jgi:hypothetical protein